MGARLVGVGPCVSGRLGRLGWWLARGGRRLVRRGRARCLGGCADALARARRSVWAVVAAVLSSVGRRPPPTRRPRRSRVPHDDRKKTQRRLQEQIKTLSRASRRPRPPNLAQRPQRRHLVRSAHHLPARKSPSGPPVVKIARHSSEMDPKRTSRRIDRRRSRQQARAVLSLGVRAKRSGEVARLVRVQSAHRRDRRAT